MIATLLTPSEVAKALKVTPVSVYRWAAAGVLPSVRIGGAVRFKESALAAFLGEPQKADPAADGGRA